MEVLVLTGMSGGGKSEALRALEDLGYFCVDNLPIPLLGRFVDLVDKAGEVTRAAMVVDVRGGEFLSGFEEVFAEISAAGHRLELVFLDATDDVLLRRFSATRRRHPLDGGDLRTGLAEERRQLAPLMAEAHDVVDTSGLTVHELRRWVRQRYAAPDSQLRVSLMSFGYKFGVPPEADLVFDVRFMRNPYFVDTLRPLAGVDNRVVSYVLDEDDATAFMDRVSDLLEFLLPRYQKEGKSYLTVAIGCTGGRHRSVVIAEALRKRIPASAGKVAVRHRDMERS